MSFLTTVTEELLSAQSMLGAVNTNLAAQNAGAAPATAVVAPAAADPVSIQQAAVFSTYGTAYQTQATEAQAQLEAYVTNLGVSSNSYGDTESTNAASAVLSDAVSPAATAAAAPGPGSSLLDILQYLLGGTGNFTNPTMLGGMFGLSGNTANLFNIGAGNWASAASNLVGMAGGGLLPAGSDTIGDAAAAAGAADLASQVTPMPIGVGGMAGMGGMPVVAGLGQGTLVGQLAVPPTWAGGQVTPLAGTSVTPLHTVGWTGAAPQAGAGTPMAGMPGMVTGAGRASSGFGAPRYGVKPIVMPKLTAV